MFCLAGDADASERPVTVSLKKKLYLRFYLAQVNDSNGESFVISINKIVTKLL